MKRKLRLLASNSEALPVGQRVWAVQDYGQMRTLAGYEVEDITYTEEYVDVRTALGYQFTISTIDYDLLMAG